MSSMRLPVVAALAVALVVPGTAAASAATPADRAFEGYRATGDRVTLGDEEAAGAPVLRTGQYLDDLDPGEVGTYLLDLPDRATPYLVATLSRPDGVARSLTADTVMLRLISSEGDQCESEYGAEVAYRGQQVSTAVLTTPLVGAEEDDPGECGQPGRYLVEVERDDRNLEGTRALPVELLVLFEPGVRDEDELPNTLEVVPEPLPAPSVPDTAPAVRGGSSFASAPDVEPGTVADGIRPGETRFFRVPVGWGQRAAVAAELDPLPDAGGTVPVELRVYDRVRRRVGADEYVTAGSVYVPRNEEKTVVSSSIPAPSYRNRLSTDTDIAASSLAGPHYVAVTLGTDADLGDRVVPYRLRVDVVGDVTGEPQYVTTPAGSAPAPTTTSAAAEPSSSAPSSSSSSSEVAAPSTTLVSGSSTPWSTIAYAVGGAAALLLAVGLLLQPLLRRSP